MKPEDVRLHHIRGFWPAIRFCAECGRIVNKWHEHHGLADFPANPVIATEKEGKP